MPLWTAEEIAAATGGAQAGDFAAEGVSIDTRTLQPGDLFIALKGPNFDGHTYVGKAMDMGAAGVLASQPVDAPHVLVADTQQGLTDLGLAARARFTGHVIGITGSVGKTTTKALAAAAYGAFSRVWATQGNLNNHLGVPLTLARMPRDTQIAIIEMGMNHFGEIAHLSRLAQPHSAIITAIDWVHSENLDGTLEGVAKAKAEICEGLSGPLFAPHALQDLLDPQLPNQDIHWIDTPFDGPMTLPGGENRWNAALALAHVPADHQQAARHAVSALAPQTGRGNALALTIDGKAVHVFNDAYNAAPASMRAAVQNLMDRPASGRRIAILGDMAELANPLELHENLGKFLAETAIDVVVAVGKFKSSILAPLPPSILTAGFEDPDAVAAHVLSILQPGDQILIKASNSTGLSTVVAELEAAATD